MRAPSGSPVSEIKFSVGPDLAEAVRQWARARLAPDPHGSGPAGDVYRVASLYLDSPALDVFEERGSYGRAKYRVRQYESGPIFLERKLKRGTRVIKRRTLVDSGELDRLAGGDPDPNKSGAWFHRRIAARQLAPACQVSYVRLARLAPGPNGRLRLTLDEDIRARPVSGYAFAEPGAPVPEVQMVLEIKFPGAMPALFTTLLEQFHLVPEPVSKYLLAMAGLGHRPQTVPAGQPQVADGEEPCPTS